MRNVNVFARYRILPKRKCQIYTDCTIGALPFSNAVRKLSTPPISTATTTK